MKTLYFECGMGAAGDMLMAALLELHPNPDDFLKRLNSAGIPKVKVISEPSVKCGIKGTRIKVLIDGGEEGHCHDHNHSNNIHRIQHTLSRLNISETVKNNAILVYNRLAEAESMVHGIPVDQIHFHEVGEMDAVADIVGVCMLIEELAPDNILASHINVGSGYVRCSHGKLPVPAPATAYILQHLPIYNDDIKGELTTPTGASLLAHFVKEFCAMPVISVKSIGYGMGTKDFERANCLRAFVGESEYPANKVAELVCNLDDMTPEAVSFAQQVLLEEGALDVYTIPIGMKKGRMGLSLTCMCNVDDRDKMISLIFKHTTTLGMREYMSCRYTLNKTSHTMETPYGIVNAKTSEGFGVKKTKIEYEDVAKIARKEGISFHEALIQIPFSH